MKILATVFAVFLWLLAGIFLLAAAHPDALAQGKSLPRAVVGALLAVGGLVLVVLAWRSGGRGGADSRGGEAGAQEPPGPLSLKALTCPHCGGQVDASSAKLGGEGSLTVTCSYCHGTFLIQEEPKW